MSDGNHEEIQLTVAEARRQKDVGKSVAKISRKAMVEIGVKQGDIVEIEGSKSSAAIVRSSYREGEGLDVARLDGLERKNPAARKSQLPDSNSSIKTSRTETFPLSTEK